MNVFVDGVMLGVLCTMILYASSRDGTLTSLGMKLTRRGKNIFGSKLAGLITKALK